MIKNYYSLSKLGKPFGLTCSRMAGVGLCSLLLCASPQVTLADVNHADAIEKVQQTTTIKGTIIDNTGFPVIGAAVVVKGTTNGVVTDFDGNFELKAKVGDVLEISYVGYKTITIKATAQPMNLTMEEDTETLDEVVVVGYGSTTKRDLIASVSTVKAEQISNMPVANIAQGLAGRSPGLIVQASGGGINSTPSISVRGGGDPLYVIDGVIRSSEDFANLSPDDIENMSILKDASATAVYGARATNGIIQITTKRGKEGKINVEYDFNQSFAQPSIWPQKMDSWDRAYWANVAADNDGKSRPYTDEAIQTMRDGSEPERYNNTNWRNLIMNDWAPQQKHTIRMTGGTETNQFYVSLGHIDQNSMIKNHVNWMKRTNFRVQNTAILKSLGITINTSIDGYRQKQSEPFSSTAQNGYISIFSHVNDKSPLLPGVNKYGLPYDMNDNPVSETAADTGYKRTTNNVINGKGEIIWALPWVEGLKVRAASNYRFASRQRKNWRKDAGEYAWDSMSPSYGSKPVLSYENYTAYSFTNQAFVDYAKQFGKHSVSVLAGFEQYYEEYELYGLQRTNYAFFIDQISVGDAETQTNSGEEGESGRAAWIGQFKYNYDNKYYVEGSFRRDGSDKFAKDKRWGNFFSGSLGWVVTAEEFMQPLVEKNILNTLKLRASYGETGMDNEVGSHAYLSSYNYNGYGYVVNGKYVPSFTEGSRLPSPEATWYTTKQMDFGFDFASLNSRLYGSFDYFYYSTKNYMQNPTGQTYLNTALGVSLPYEKSDSEWRRAGVELQLGWRDQIGDFKYDVAANFTYFDEMWAFKEDESESSKMNPYQRGQQVKGSYGLLYHNLGFYQSSEEVYNSVGFVNSFNSGNLLPGDIRYEDTNGDGKIDSNDQRRLGKADKPRGQYGININLSYKGFYFSTLFQGSTRFDMYIPSEIGLGNGQQGNLKIAYEHQTDHWRLDNRSAKYPRLMVASTDNQNNNYQSSDFWLLDGSYLRMKDFQFGYDFKYKLLKNVTWLSRCKVGISGQNIFTISKSTKYGLDPENSSTNNYGYPVERTLAFTLNLGF